MAGRLNARRAVAAAAAVLVLSTGVTLVVATAPAGAQIDDWQPCEAAADSGRIERIEIALVIDRSGSLENVDPNGTSRRRALYGTRESLVGLQESVSQLLGESNSGADLGIDLALVAFDARSDTGTGAETVAGFARVSGEHPPDGRIQAALSKGGNTDYGPAVEEALGLFKGSSNAESGATCRILVLFTDGVLDPYDTAPGERPSLERQAESHVANLLDDLCASDPGLRRYRQRLGALGVSSYVAVLANDDFQRGAGSSHLDVLAGASKQMFLALTGHVASPLLRGVSAAAGCESWSAERSGKVVEMEGIGELVGELTDVVGEVGLAVRAPRIRCTPGVVPEVGFAGEWPHGYDISDPAGEPLCVVTPPLDGEMVLRAGGPQLPGGAVWLIGSGAGAEESSRLTAGDEDLLFDVTSSRLPSDEPVGAVEGATIEIAATWFPDPELRAAWPRQPDEVGVVSAPLGIDLPDREVYWIERLVYCREYQRAGWEDPDGGVRATAAGLCAVEGPPAGEFEMALVPDGDNELGWSAARAGDAGGLDPAPGETVLLAPGDPSVSIGARSQVLALAEAPSEEFEDRVGYRLIWRSPRGSVLADRSWSAAIAVRPPDPDPPVECGAEAQVTAARQGVAGEWAIVVDSGCRLVSPPQGTSGVTVTGDARGRAWQLTEPPPEGEQSWPTRDSIALSPGEPDRRLFVGVSHPELEGLIGEDIEFTLVSTRYDEASRVVRQQRATRRVAVYLPVVRCESDVEAVRVGVAAPGGGSEQRARAERLCTVDRPPNGFLEIRPADAPPGPALGWQTLVDGDDSEVLIVESGRDPAVLDVRSGPLRSDLLGPFDSGIDVYLNWVSANGHASGSTWRGVVAVQEDPPVLLDCSSAPASPGSGGEIPERPLAFDTGCVLLTPPAGDVALIGVEGAVAGVSWRLPAPVRLTPSDDDRRIHIETDGVLPNEPLNRTVTFELVAALTVGDYTPVPDREERNVQVRFQPRIRIRCTEPPAILGNPVEVPEGPLVVDTGCVLQAPAAAGEVTVEVADGEVAGVGWVVRGDVRLEAGDDDVPILIETAGPLPNRRYDAFAEFSLAAIWRSPGGVEQSVGSQPAPGGAPTEVAVALRARPNSGQAALLAVALLVGGLLAGWLLLAGLGQRANRLPSSGAYRLVSGQATATVTPGTGVKLEGFDLAQLLQGKSEPLIRRRGRLRAGDLTIRVQRQWWNPRDLLDGGRAAVAPTTMKNALVAAAPSSGRPDSLRPTLAPGAVVVALESAPSVSKQDGDRHRARVWVLIPSGGKQASGAQQNAERNLRTARDQLRKRVAPKSATGAGKR